MKGLGLLVVAVALIALTLAFDTAFAWFAIEVVGGHDISFREALGAGLILSLLDVSSNSRR